MAALSLFGQDEIRTNCTDNIYSTSEKKPQFGSSLNELEGYLKDNLSFIALEHQYRGVFSISMNCEGTIFKVDFHKGNLAKREQNAIIKLMLAMPKWAPAEFKDREIDYQFFIDFLFVKDRLTINPFMR